MAEKKDQECFIIMPITVPKPMLEQYRDGKTHFEHVLNCLFMPAVEKAGYTPIPPTAKGADFIHANIIKNLETAGLVLCDMSVLNLNVFFEFGIRTSLNKPVCVVKDELVEKVPFDTTVLNHREYQSSLDPWLLDDEIKKLAEHIKASAENSKGENSLWKYFGLKSKATPYEAESGAAGQLDYLTLQVDSIKQTLEKDHPKTGNSPVSLSKQPAPSTIELAYDDVINKLNSEGVNIIEVSRHGDKLIIHTDKTVPDSLFQKLRYASRFRL